MEKKEFEKFMNIIKKLDEKSVQLMDAGIDLESDIIKNISESISLIIDYLNERWGSTCDDIGWFIYENEWGKKNFSITIEKPIKKEFVIKSMDDMYNYLNYFYNKNEENK